MPPAHRFNGVTKMESKFEWALERIRVYIFFQHSGSDRKIALFSAINCRSARNVFSFFFRHAVECAMESLKYTPFRLDRRKNINNNNNLSSAPHK